VVDPLQPYGPLLETRLRLVTWNVWARHGPWERRQDAIAATLSAAEPDVVVLAEAWSAPDADQAASLAARIGLGHHCFAGGGAEDGIRSGAAVVARWPITEHEVRSLDAGTGRLGSVLRAEIAGPRGPVRVFAVMLDWPPHYSHVRQAQVRELADYVGGFDRTAPTAVCGDFNAPPDSDEIRMLTGLTAGCRVAWRDAWETADPADPGNTWSNANPWAAPMLLRAGRIDYVFAGPFGPGGRGQPVAARVVGREPVDGVVASDHYGVLAELRY
jgi:endonuclease/exonuclease/phosphatase family metal-dependent hydrolase